MSDEKKAPEKPVGHKAGPRGNLDTGRSTIPPATQSDQALAGDMAIYGITRVPVDNFHFRDFRYTSLKDALAQAKRSVQL